LSSQFLRFVLAVIFLGYASLRDIEEREVPDKVWILSVPACLALTLLDVCFEKDDPMLLLVSLLIAFVLGVVLCHFGFYGGADAKALLLIATAFPSYPKDTGSLMAKFFPAPFLLVFSSSTLISIVCPLTVLTLNSIDILRGLNPLREVEEENVFRRFILLATARRVRFETLKRSLKYFPAEKIVEEEGKTRRKPLFFVHAEADVNKLVQELEEHEDVFVDGVLASPTIPMIVFLFCGFALSYLTSLFIHI